MASAIVTQEFEIDYDVSYRAMDAACEGRDVCSKDKFHTQARFTRSGKGRSVNGAHRRKTKKSYV